uniref:MTSS I-BAR domain containing 1 n=1 Tax=Lates calcarifer TaxID=8187 RepID=A0A4W6D3C0_LATCA
MFCGLVSVSFLDAFQKVADMATGTRGATKEIGSALTRMCMRHRSIESKLKLFTTALSESLITPLELKMEEWKKVASQLDKDHAKEYKKARADIKKKSSDTIKLQKKVKKGKDEVRGQLDSALQDVNVRYAVLEDTEKRAVCRALIEERARYCSFVTMLKPVLDHEINMLGEVTHLQTILEDLMNLTAEPNKLPPASEQVISDLKGSDFNYTYQTPPASPSNTLSRKSSIRCRWPLQSDGCWRKWGGGEWPVGPPTQRLHPPWREESSHVCIWKGNTHIYSAGQQETRGGQNALLSSPLLSSPLLLFLSSPLSLVSLTLSPFLPLFHLLTLLLLLSSPLVSLPCSCSARDQLALTLGALNSDAPRSSRDSLHCSSGYSTQTTTPSCSEDTIHTHIDYESISLHGDADSISLHHLSHGNSQSDFDKSSTIPRNSDLVLQYRKFAQSKRPASTVSLLAEPELIGGSVRQLPSHTATIRRKPSSKPAYRRGTISGGVPIPICTPQVPLKALGGNSGSDENVFAAPPAGGAGGLGHSKLCTSTQSLSALPPSSSPYYQLVPGQMPIPVPVPTVPSLPPEGSTVKQQQQRQYQQNLQQQHNQQLQIQQQQQYYQQLQQQQQLQHKQSLPQQPQQLLHQQDQYQQPDQHQLNQQQKQKLFQQQHQTQFQPSASQGEPSSSWPGHSTHCQPQAPPPTSQAQNQEQQTQGGGEGGEGGGDMLKLIRGVKLKRTITNDRSAPLLPPPPNHK